MVKMIIKTNDYIVKKVKKNGRININGVLCNKNVKLIPVPFNKPIKTTVNDDIITIELNSNEIISKQYKKNVYVSKLYEGADILIVPAEAEVYIDLEQKRKYKKNSYDKSSCREIVMSQSYKYSIVSAFDVIDQDDNLLKIDNLIMRATSEKGSNCCIYISNDFDISNTYIFSDEVYNY